jgi:hypothetical protein
MVPRFPTQDISDVEVIVQFENSVSSTSAICASFAQVKVATGTAARLHDPV